MEGTTVSWLEALFARDEPRRATAPVPAAPVQSFTERATASLDTLADATRAAGSRVSTQVFSQLRSIDDVVRPLIAHVATHPVVIETEIAIESLITDYVPTPLRLFLELPAAEAVDGGKADLLLQEQFTALERSARKLSLSVYGDSVSALETHAIFIQNKFRE
jgi:hypothetical protein